MFIKMSDGLKLYLKSAALNDDKYDKQIMMYIVIVFKIKSRFIKS